MKKVLILLILVAANILFAQSPNISFKIDGYDNDTLILGYYYGDKQLVVDTLFTKVKGEFTWKDTAKIQDGMYIALVKPENTFIQFLLESNNPSFSIKFNKENTSDVKFKGSKVNTAFYGYMDFLRDLGKKAEPLRDSVKSYESRGKNADTEKAKLDALDKEVKAFQKKTIEENPGYLAKLLLSSIEPEMKEFNGSEEEKQMQRYLYYKSVYFNNIDFNYPSLIRTPYIHNKIDTYIKKLTSQHPDSIIVSLKMILKKLENNPEAEKYYLSHFLNEYANSNIIGMDKVFLWINDNYYAKGKAPWVSADNLAKILKSAEELRPIIIGKIFPNITTYKEDKTPVVLHQVKSAYTLLIFWSPDCGHCAKAMPDLVKYSEEYKTKGLTTISVCTRPGEKVITCWEGVKEKKMENLINTGDEFQRFQQIIPMPKTPKFFILDDKKEILFKDFPADKLGEILKEIIEKKI
jgi:thiol-disulfide isomerase/thioredoxin